MLVVELVGFYGGGKVQLCIVGKCASVEAEHLVPLAAAGRPEGAGGSDPGHRGPQRDTGQGARCCETGSWT